MWGKEENGKFLRFIYLLIRSYDVLGSCIFSTCQGVRLMRILSAKEPLCNSKLEIFFHIHTLTRSWATWPLCVCVTEIWIPEGNWIGPNIHFFFSAKSCISWKMLILVDENATIDPCCLPKIYKPSIFLTPSRIVLAAIIIMLNLVTLLMNLTL